MSAPVRSGCAQGVGIGLATGVIGLLLLSPAGGAVLLLLLVLALLAQLAKPSQPRIGPPPPPRPPLTPTQVDDRIGEFRRRWGSR